jgi:aldose 1-epimerase
MSIQTRRFGQNREGQNVDIYTLTNRNGASVAVLTHGGTLQSITVPDKHGRLADVCLGFDSMEAYNQPSGYLGAFIGRYGNRIRAGRFTLDGKMYQLNLDKNGIHLHGGAKGFDLHRMDAETAEGDGIDYVVMKTHSPDGEERYPGRLDMTVTYAFDDGNNLAIAYTAVTDAATVLNLTNHCYFNLAGHASGTVEDHLISIPADCVTRIAPDVIPTGDYLPVAGTPLDLRGFKRIGDGLREGETCRQMVLGTGYDHNYVLNKGSAMGLAAVVKDPASGRVMEVLTDQPGVQFYSGNHTNVPGKGGAHYGAHSGLCLETQHFPDSPNQPHFPSTVLRPGERFASCTIYAFGCE